MNRWPAVCAGMGNERIFPFYIFARPTEYDLISSPAYLMHCRLTPAPLADWCRIAPLTYVLENEKHKIAERQRGERGGEGETGGEYDWRK